MAVWCRQSVDGVPDPPYVIDAEAHPDLGGDDAALLKRKADGAADKGWKVKWRGARRFTATKIRWQTRSLCVREFWIE